MYGYFSDAVFFFDRKIDFLVLIRKDNTMEASPVSHGKINIYFLHLANFFNN